MTFKELGLAEPILKALETEGYSHPTPIQEQAIPILLEGKDLLGVAQTGTGKTAAFGIPILHHLYERISLRQNKRKVKALVVTPTRELAIQIGERIVKIGKKILSLIFTMCKEYPSTTFGAIFGATVGLLISSIPVLGFILGPIALPLLIIVGIGVGAIEDIKDKMLARKIKEINAEFSPLNA
jgi:hypothetical protein